MNRLFVPRIGVVAVLGLATLLIGVIILRSPDTHANLWNEVRDGYSRTDVGMVAAEGQTAVTETSGSRNSDLLFLAPTWPVVLQGEAASRIPELGERLYIASGCAKCHGLEGQGGIVGPPLAGLDPEIVTAMARIGPRGMPAFPTDMLSEDALAKLAAYVGALKPVGPVIASEEEPTKATMPVSQAPSTAPSPSPEGALAGGDEAKGKRLFGGKCAACHGQDGSGGYGPSLIGLGPEAIERAVRQGQGNMPSFGTESITDQALRDIASYLHSLALSNGGRP